MPTKKSIDYEKTIQELDQKLKRYEILINQFTPQYNRLIDSGTSLVKYLFAMNAGAILALLTFVGNERISCLFVELHFTFKMLIGGVIAAIGSGCAEYMRQDWSLRAFKQQFDDSSLKDKITNEKFIYLLNFSRILALISLFAFVGAIINALRVLTSVCR